jgi:hypothetical protein
VEIHGKNQLGRKTPMKMVDGDEIFYFNSGDDIRVLNQAKVDVYNTEFKSEINFTTTQLSFFFQKIKDN